jgi:TolA-binding protein
MKKTGLILLAAFAFTAAPAGAQTLYFQNGDVEWGEVTLSGTNLQRKIKRPDGSEAIQSIPAANVIRVSWPYPQELQDALQLILKQKYDEALAKATTVRDIHQNWKDKPGSWYVPATLLAVECHIRKNNAAETDKILTELRNMALTGPFQIGLAMMEALESFQKDMVGPALAKAEPLVKGADDSPTLARLYVLLGDIKFKREDYTGALDSYLRVPVFFGSQGALMPVAELGAARSLVRLGRLQDASTAFARIIERYKDTPEAAVATTEKEDADKLLSGGPAPAAAEKKPDDAEK